MRTGTGTRRDAQIGWALAPQRCRQAREETTGDLPSWAARTTAPAIGKATSRSNAGPSASASRERPRPSEAHPRQAPCSRTKQQHARNPYLRGHDNSDGRAGNIQSLLRLSRRTEKRWRKTVSRRSQDGAVHGEKFQKLKRSFPLVRPTLSITSVDFQAYASCEPCSEERSAGNPACYDLWGRVLGNHALYPAAGWVTIGSTRADGSHDRLFQSA